MISDRPALLTVDSEHRPHNDTGPFCCWRDGSALYAVHGVRVPRWLIEAPERLTAKHVRDEPNAEVRRVMLERFGVERYLRELGAKPAGTDEFGTLYRVELPGDEPLVMVEVVNSTAERDGHYKRYMLRVPPNVQTAREAVAWTFGVSSADYQPAIET